MNIFVPSALLALAFAVPAAAQAPAAVNAGALRIEAPWTRATPAGAKVAGGFLKIINMGAAPDRLLSGATEAAGRFEIHEMAIVDGVMKMRELAKGLEIAPGATVELKPGSYHLMFMDLKRPIVKGEALRATLVFEKAGKIDVAFPASAIGAPAANEHKSGEHKH